MGTLVAGRFLVEARAGAGGMGTVYRALDRVSGAPVALKSAEAVVRYVAHGRDAEGALYLVMEWLDGRDLAAHVARGPRSPSPTSKASCIATSSRGSRPLDRPLGTARPGLLTNTS
ncbi:MAG: hypothetical protein ACXWP4_01940 [Polyangiales bacterium]